MLIEKIAAAAIPAVIALCGVLMLVSKKPLFDAFVGGAKSGMQTAFGLFPTLCVLFCAVSMFQSSGLAEPIAGILSKLGVPDELAPFLVMRPFSGSGSIAILADIFKSSGPDSASGLAASVIMASSDTMFYVVSVYYSSAGVKKPRYTMAAAFIVMMITTISAIILTQILL